MIIAILFRFFWGADFFNFLKNFRGFFPKQHSLLQWYIVRMLFAAHIFISISKQKNTNRIIKKGDKPMSIKHNIKIKGGKNNAGFYGRSEGTTQGHR